ncbi:MAG: Jag N-terminal domain-containing protein [Clostridia bacterium]|nr:Jag N-terminal domain-containing protein [Clostridia bacterium]
MHSCEGTGKNIEQAINNALLELKAAREDVDIKILSEGGFLKKAKVLVTISADAVEKYEKREKFKEELSKEETDEDFAENFMKRKIETAKETEVKVEEKAEEPKQERKIQIITDEEYVAPKKVESDEVIGKLTGEEFLQGVLSAMELQGEIEKLEDDRFVRYGLTGENLNDLIGYHGECMLALSHLMNVACKSESKKRFVLDVEHYREKRAEALTDLAKKVAGKVAKTGRYHKFEPMEASERKIIHTALQEDDRVTTLSKGEEPRRYLIVFPREYSERD